MLTLSTFTETLKHQLPGSIKQFAIALSGARQTCLMQFLTALQNASKPLIFSPKTQLSSFCLPLKSVNCAENSFVKEQTSQFILVLHECVSVFRTFVRKFKCYLNIPSFLKFCFLNRFNQNPLYLPKQLNLKPFVLSMFE